MIKWATWLLWLGIATACQSPSVEPERIQPSQQAEVPLQANVEQNASIPKNEVAQPMIVTKAMRDKPNCQYKEGIHTASVKYLNPETGHAATYDLQVHVANCKVVRLDFPNGGWLDEDHIPATAIDNKGKAKFNDDKGRSWEVNIIDAPQP